MVVEAGLKALGEFDRASRDHCSTSPWEERFDSQFAALLKIVDVMTLADPCPGVAIGIRRIAVDDEDVVEPTGKSSSSGEAAHTAAGYYRCFPKGRHSEVLRVM